MRRDQAAKQLAFGLVLLAFFAAGCGDEEVVEVVQEPAIRVDVSASSDSIEQGGRVTAVAAVTAENAGTLSYAWKATGGAFTDAAAETTVWIAPDDPNLYTLSCVVTDGVDAGIGADKVWVGDYVPSVQPFYIGAATCGVVCHSGGGGGNQYTTWVTTAHAGAVETLREAGMGTNAFCLQCHTVGSYGLFADPGLDNGGYDETAVARLEGVQCENCHGPASDHVGGGDDEDKGLSEQSVAITMSDSLCGQCHTDEHHPTWEEWQESAHAGIVSSAAGRASCAKCHNGLVAKDYLDDPLHFQAPSANPTESIPHTCPVCHDPHGNDNLKQLRDASVTDVALPNSPLIPNAGAGRLCMSCHNGRRTETDVNSQVNDGSEHLGPHHSCQGDMLAGVNGYEDIDTNFAFTSSMHILVQDACITCHVSRDESTLPVYTGHTFEPTTSACLPCHGAITDFSEVGAKEDYDGNGTIEGVQGEVTGLLDTLRAVIIAAAPTEEAREELESAELFIDVVGDTLFSTPAMRAASYNWAFVDFDGSHGVHNATYAVQLLQRSILSLDPGKIEKAHLLVE